MSWEIGNPIPDDWQEEVDGWAVGLFLFPNSRKWGFIARTVLRVLSRGRFWARDSGSIVDAQDAGRLAYMSFTYVSFQQLLDAIEGIESAVSGLRVATSVNVSCCDQLTAPQPPGPPAGDLPTVDPLPEEVPPSYATPAAYNAELCRSANALHWLISRYLGVLSTLDTVSAGVAVIVALIAILFPEAATTVIGGITLTTIVTALIVVEGGITFVATWAEDSRALWDLKQQEFTCLFYEVIGSAESWKDDIVAYVENFIVGVSDQMDSDVARRAVSWVRPLLDWLENDIYDGLGTLESHPNPVSCVACSACSCGDCQGDLISVCLPDDTIVPPATVSVTPGSLLEPEDYSLSWDYTPTTGVFLLNLSITGETVGTTPGVTVDVTLPDNGLAVKRRIMTIFSSEEVGGWNLGGCSLSDGGDMAVATSAGSEQRSCMESELVAAGFSLPCGTVGSDVGLSFNIETTRPGLGYTHTLSLGMTICYGMVTT